MAKGERTCEEPNRGAELMDCSKFINGCCFINVELTVDKGCIQYLHRAPDRCSVQVDLHYFVQVDLQHWSMLLQKITLCSINSSSLYICTKKKHLGESHDSWTKPFFKRYLHNGDGPNRFGDVFT